MDHDRDALYREVIDETSDLVTQVDREGRILFANRASVRIWGHPPDECIGRSAFDFLHPDDTEHTKRIFADWLRGQATNTSFENRQVSRQGVVRNISWTVSLHEGDDGNPSFFNSIGRDITERRRAETEREALTEDLARTTKLLETVLNAIPDVIGLQDRHHQVLRYNDAGYRFLQMTPSQVRGKKCHQLIGNLVPCDTCATSEAYETKKPSRIEKYVEEMDLHLDVRAYPILDETGEVALVVEHMRDITEERRLEDRIRQVQEMETVGQLAGGIAHDFNNLLSPILGLSSLLLKELEPKDPVHEQVAIIVDAANQARSLTQQLLAFGRKQALEIKHLALGELVGRFEKMIRRALREDIQLRIVPPPGEATVTGDAFQLQQILMNLALNAQDSMLDGGTLTIEIEDTTVDETTAAKFPGLQAGPYFAIAFSDTGHGMDEATRNRVFDPFFTTKEVGKGTGLGLATAYGIAKQHGGGMSVESEEGRGSTFRVLLPRAEKSGKVAKVLSTPVPAAAGETVMVVEDDALVRKMTTKLLRHWGYEVIVAATPYEALHVIEQRADDLDLLLTDVVMPGLNGRELYDRAKAIRADLKVLFMSGYTRDVIDRRGALEEEGRLLVKPFSIDTLASMVREALDS